MADFSGVIPAIEVAPLIWSLPLLPLAGALLAARVARLEGEPEGGAAWAAPVATWLSLLALMPLAYRLGSLNGTEKALLAPGLVLLRVGTIDLHLGLTLDGVAACFVLVMLLVASLVQLGLLLAPGSARKRQELAALMSAATAAGVFALLASCPLISVIGAGLVVLCGGVANETVGPATKEPGRGGAPLVGEILLLAGAAALSWGLVGAWSSGELLPASRERYVAISRGGDAAKKSTGQASGYLTLTTTPGARISLDNDSKILAEAPFVRLPVPAGPHSITIDPGHGADPETLRSVRLIEEGEVTLVRLDGASDAVGVATLTNLHQGETPVLLRGRLSDSFWAGIPIAHWVGLLLSAGLLLKLLPPRSPSATEQPRTLRLLIPQIGGLLIASLMAIRWLPLLSLGTARPTLPLILLYTGASAMALAGLLERQPARALGLSASASAALGFTAAASGLPGAAALQGLVAAIAAALGLWGLAQAERPDLPWDLASYQGIWADDEANTRWFKLAYAGLIGLLPVGFGLLEVLRSQGWLRLLLLPVVALVSASLGRVVYSMCEGEGPEPTKPKNLRRDERKTAQREGDPDPVLDGLLARFSLLLAALLVALGPLGAATVYDAPLASWLGASLAPRTSAPASSILTFGLWVLLSICALLGARWARARYGAQRAKEWSEQDAGLFPQKTASSIAQSTRAVLESLASTAARLGARLASPFER